MDWNWPIHLINAADSLMVGLTESQRLSVLGVIAMFGILIAFCLSVMTYRKHPEEFNGDRSFLPIMSLAGGVALPVSLMFVTLVLVVLWYCAIPALLGWGFWRWSARLTPPTADPEVSAAMREVEALLKDETP